MTRPDTTYAAGAAASGGEPGAGPGTGRRRLLSWTGGQYLGVLAVLLLAVVVLTATEPKFLTVRNFTNVAEANAVLLIVAVGLTFVLLIGGIDLSVGGMMALAAVGLWSLLTAGVPAPLAAALVVVGAVMVGGAVNGLLIGKAGLSFLVVTIGTASLFRGLANVRSGGQSQTIYQYGWLVRLGSGTWLGVPVPVWLAGAIFVLALVVLRYTGYGRMVYATGGNAEAARLAGMPVAAIRASVYAISGGLAGLAAVLDAGRLTSASPGAGTGIELTAGAAVLLGGTSFLGGRGGVLGTLLGVLFIGVLNNGLTLAGISPFWAGVVSGAVLIVAIAIDRIRLRRGPR